MVDRLVRSSAPRRTVALAALAFSALGAIVSPAAAANTGTTTAAPGTAVAATSTNSSGRPLLGAVPGSAVLNQKIAQAYTEYERAREDVARIGEQAAGLAESADQANALAARLHAEVGHSKGGTLMDVVADLFGDDDLDRAAEAAETAAQATERAATVERALKDAIAETERTRLAWEAARDDLERVEERWTAVQAAEAAARRAAFRPGYAVADDAQDRRNRAALRRWQDYLRSVGDAGVVPPAAEKLRNPDRLPNLLEMLRDRHGRAVIGVAKTDTREPVTVLPSETVRAVSAAFSRVGLTEVPGAIAASTYACGGFVANAWGATDTLPADSVNQWRELRTVPFASLQVGDVVVLGSKTAGLDQSGVYVGRREVILADPKTGTAAVQALPRRELYGVKRVGLPTTRIYSAPKAGACGAEVTPATSDWPATGNGATIGDGATGGSPLVLPVAEGQFTLTAPFGATSALWSSGSHTGLDFAAATGTPVFAVADGVVTVETHDWAGELVRIDHGGGVETWYAHNSEVDVTSGQQVTRGQVIGAVGSEGNSTGPHLHFEVRLDGVPVDPALVLDLAELPRPSYSNGEIPTSALCSATTDGGQLLGCDAAVAFRLLSAAYATETGDALCVTDSYRSRAGQEMVYRTKPELAAVPGTSVHGDGRAVDLCGGVERFGTSQHNWMVQRGPAFGWVHPSWAAAGGSRPEPWHFEYGA